MRRGLLCAIAEAYYFDDKVIVSGFGIMAQVVVRIGGPEILILCNR